MKVFLSAGLARSLVTFRGPLLAAMVARGHEVHAAAPGLSADTETAARLCDIGVTIHDIPFDRTSLNPLGDLRALFALVRLMRRIRPDVVLGYTIKPVVWGTIAAHIARVPHRFALITGLGYAFAAEARGRRRLVQIFARNLYRLALDRTEKVFFQNPDDQDLFRSLGILAQEVSSVVVNGSGVDLAHYAPAPLPDAPVFLLIGRLLGDKGIREYAAAARAVHQTHPEAQFLLVGGRDASPDAISPDEVAAWQKNGTLIVLGRLSDVRPAIARAQVYVLPSYYREGTPRSILEAMAMGRPVITTDAPGCRETVVEGENGFLVPVRDEEALAAAMRRFLDSPELVAAMGKRSIAIAEEKYDVHKVNAVMLREMGL